PVERGTADRGAMRLAEQILDEGDALVIFPEGAVSEDGTMHPFHHGLALIALRTGAPVVPVGLLHTDELIPYGKFVPRLTRHQVVIRYGDPVPLADLWQPR